MKNYFRLFASYLVIFVITLVIAACSGTSNSETKSGSTSGTSTSGPTTTSTTLANGTVVTVANNNLTVPSGATTSTTVGIYGGNTITGISFSAKTTQTLTQSALANATANAIIVTFTPDTLVSNTGGKSSSTLLANATGASPGTYYVSLYANYNYNGKINSTFIGTVKITVETSSNLVAGILQLESSTIISNDQVQDYALTLGGSSGVKSLNVTFTSSNPSIIQVNTPECTVSSDSNSCIFQLSSVSVGSATITASANGYESATMFVSIVQSYESGVLSLPASASVKYASSGNIVLSLKNSAKVESFPVTITSSNPDKVAVNTNICTLSSSNSTCNIGLTAKNYESGQVTITARADNYGYAPTSSTVTITNVPAESAGTLSLTPNPVHISYNTTKLITLSLNNSIWQNNIPVTISSSESQVISVDNSTCNLSTTANSCEVAITAMANESGSVTITASSPGYESATTVATVTDVPTPTYGSLSVFPNNINFSQNIESVALILIGESNVLPFSLNVTVTSENDQIASVNPSSQNCNFTGDGICYVYLNKGSVAGTTNIVFTPSDLNNYSIESITATTLPIYGAVTLNISPTPIGSGSTAIATVNIVGSNTNTDGLVFQLQSSDDTIASVNLPQQCTIESQSCSIPITAMQVGAATISATNANYSNSAESIITVAPLYTWMGGSSTVNQSGTYSGTNLMPGGRYSAVFWSDRNTNTFITFGGRGYGASAESYGFLSDLWQYNTNSRSWSLLKGTGTINESGSYGQLGQGAESNMPPSRFGGASWFNSNNRTLYLFGGFGYQAKVGGMGDFYNDLWKYDLNRNIWTWVNGPTYDSGIYGSYGTLLIESSTNLPSARHSPASWLDSDGNFWLFGGFGDISTNLPSGTLNDLWRYNPTNNMWTWMNGSQDVNSAGNYGTINVESFSNSPPGRQGMAYWQDSSGNLWIFGGLLENVYSNDLWRYNPTNNMWTWMKGSESENSKGIYGTQGVPLSTNTPSARYGSSHWVDSSGNFWLFGGFGIDSNGNVGNLNDLWRYNPTNNMWTWMGGSSSTDAVANYGQLYISSIDNVIAPRIDGSYGWIDSSDNLWLIGGYRNGYLNDLWKITIKY